MEPRAGAHAGTLGTTPRSATGGGRDRQRVSDLVYERENDMYLQQGRRKQFNSGKAGQGGGSQDVGGASPDSEE